METKLWDYARSKRNYWDENVVITIDPGPFKITIVECCGWYELSNFSCYAPDHERKLDELTSSKLIGHRSARDSGGRVIYHKVPFFSVLTEVQLSLFKWESYFESRGWIKGVPWKSATTKKVLTPYQWIPHELRT